MSHLMRAMEARARELGWETESKWRDGYGGPDDSAEYVVYLWRDEPEPTQEPAA